MVFRISELRRLFIRAKREFSSRMMMGLILVSLLVGTGLYDRPELAVSSAIGQSAVSQTDVGGQPLLASLIRADGESREGSRLVPDISTHEIPNVVDNSGQNIEQPTSGANSEVSQQPTVAVDGTALWDQPSEVQELFITSYGEDASRIWAEQHNQNLAAKATDQVSVVEREVEPEPMREFSGSQALSASSPAVPVEVTGESPRVGIQAGHWKCDELPAELASLRSSTGAESAGRREVDINLDIARRVVALLGESGVQAAELLPATVPPHYEADAFVALHGDANGNSAASGYKLARATASQIPEKDDALMAAIKAEYQAATGLKEHPQSITQNMLRYYAFDNQRLEHAVHPSTPAVILEMGFVTNPSDRALLTEQAEKVADGIAKGVLQYLSSTQGFMNP